MLSGYLTNGGTEYRIPAPFFNQNDNSAWSGAAGNVQCCPTSNALFAFYHSPSFRDKFIASNLREPEDYYKQQFEAAGYGASDRGNHDAHTKTLERIGVRSRWTTKATDEQIINALNDGQLLVAGLRYKVAGHIVAIAGYYGKGLATQSQQIYGYLIHDPYGLRDGAADSYGYINPREDGVVKGAYDRYSYDILQLLLFDEPKAGAWVRFFEGLINA